MSKKTLLLNSSYEVLSFIVERKAIKLLLKGKVELLSVWNGRKIYSNSGVMEHPATLKMKYHVTLRPTKLTFSRKLVLRRDEYTCCYCYLKFKHNDLTIDHVIPKSAGGSNSFTNCVTACFFCNRRKRNRTPEQAGMILRKQPVIPNKYLCYFPENEEYHEDWVFFVR